MSATFYDFILSGKQRSYLDVLSESLHNLGVNIDFTSKGGQAFVRTLRESASGDLEPDPYMKDMIRRASWFV